MSWSELDDLADRAALISTRLVQIHADPALSGAERSEVWEAAVALTRVSAALSRLAILRPREEA